MYKKTILLDLDGVLNIYSGKYNEKFIEPVSNGAFEFIKDLSVNYKIVIFTSRNLLQASKWVIENGLEEFIENVTNVKEPAYLTIDDRCIKFNGNFSDLKSDIENFEVWYKN